MERPPRARAQAREGDGVAFVRARLRREAACGACGRSLARGERVVVGVGEGDTARVVACTACAADPAALAPVPEAATAAATTAAATSLATTPLARGSIVVWVAVALLGVAAALTSRTVRRLAVTAWVGARALGRWLAARIRGRRDAAPAIVRAAFEDLGPTYVKLGQLVASSEGLFPERYCVEMRKCLDRVRPFPFEQVRRTLREELGRDPDEVFAWIDPQPLASASIAQVHAARLHDGQEVVVKVQRPKIAEIVEADLRVLRLAARVLSLSSRAELANPVGIVEDFEANIREELDFAREAANMDEFNRIMAAHGHADVVAPRVVHERTTRRVLVMERFHGHRVDDVDRLRAAAVDGEEKLLAGMRAWFRCMILYGFFHGDVHAGNLMALADGRIGFLDFGIVGRFERARREQVTDYLLAFAAADFRR